MKELKGHRALVVGLGYRSGLGACNFLAKRGFTQSSTYFAWRNTHWDLTQYFRELTRTGVREFFRPNLWPNTPDILTEYLQFGGRPAFLTRFVLAATLSRVILSRSGT